MNATHTTPASEVKLQRLFSQASNQQWQIADRLDFNSPLTLDDETRQAWVRLGKVFYTLEKMGLGVLATMADKASTKLQSEDARAYLSVQYADEARHVEAIEQYLTRLGGAPVFEKKYQVLGQVASLGFYRVENWLFSTLFSENFASSFLRRAKGANIDAVGAEMCRSLLVDESRHIHFLHIVLPEVMDRLSLVGRAYVKVAQRFIINFTARVSGTLAHDGGRVGIDRRALLEEVFENMEKAYAQLGASKDFLHFPQIRN